MTNTVQSLTVENQQLRKKSAVQEGSITDVVAKQKPYHQGDDGAVAQNVARHANIKGDDILLLEQQAELLANELEAANRGIITRDEHIRELTDELRSKLDFVSTLNKKNKRLTGEKKMSEKKLLESIEKSVFYKKLADDFDASLNSLKDLQSSTVSEANAIKTDRGEIQQKNDELYQEVSYQVHVWQFSTVGKDCLISVLCDTSLRWPTCQYPCNICKRDYVKRLVTMSV